MTVNHDPALTIILRPLPASPWLAHDIAFRTSLVTLPAPLGLHVEVVEVLLNGKTLRHKAVDRSTVIVSPMVPEQGDYLTIRCKGLESPSKALQWRTPADPTPEPTYGLTAPTSRHQRR